MPIYDQSYKRWEGTFKSHAFRWWVIARGGIKVAFKKKVVKRVFVLALLPFVVFAVYVYGLTHIGKVSKFVQGLAGGDAMPRFSGKVYEVEIEGDSGRFLETLREEGLRLQGYDEPPAASGVLRITVPEGENSKKIRAVARETGTTISRLVPPGLKADFYNGYLTRLFLFQFMLLLAVGMGLISKDVKFNALPIYLAKPITAVEYVLGKLGTLLFFLLTVTLVPGILLFLLQGILLGDILYVLHYWWVPGAILGYSLVITLSGALIILAVSAFSRNDRTAAFGGAAVFWLSRMVAEMLRSATWNDKYMLISFQSNLKRMGEKIFGLETTTEIQWEWSFLILVGLMLLSVVALFRRVRAVEVVK